jgi:hypothetical protein
MRKLLHFISCGFAVYCLLLAGSAVQAQRTPKPAPPPAPAEPVDAAPAPASTATASPAPANPAAAEQAPDDVIHKVGDLVNAGKYADALQLTTGLLTAYPNDQRLINTKELLT